MSPKTSSKGWGFILLLGILVGSVSGYFLNWLFPFETLVGPGPWAEDTVNPPNGLLQTETVQSTVFATIEGTDLLETLVPGMEINLTIRANSVVELTFIASYFISLFTNFQYGAEWNVSILVDGIAVISSNIFEYRTNKVNETEYEGGNLAMNCMVSHLPAGEHSFKVVYFSVHTKVNCRLNIRTSGYNFERYLTVSEWSTQ